MGSVGVKLVAAPDAPLRGEVLARALVGLHCVIQGFANHGGARRGAASTDTYLLRGFHERPALAKGPGCQRATYWAVSYMPQCAGSGYSETGLPARRGLESGICRGQHATAGFGRPHLRLGPHPGKDP